MNKLYLAIISLFIVNISNSQVRYEKVEYNKNVIELDSVVDIKPIDFVVSHWSDEIICSNDEKNIMLLDYNSKATSKLGFFKLNLKNYKLLYYEIEMPDVFTKKEIWKKSNLYLSNIAFNDKYVAFQYYDMLYILEYQNNFKLSLFNKIKLNDKHISYLKFLKDNVLLIGRSFDIMSDKNPFYLTTYDVEKGKKIKSVKCNNSLGELTHFYPNHYIDATSNFVLFTEPSEYNIQVYDENLATASFYKYENESWIKVSDKTLERLDRYDNVKFRVKTLMKYYSEFSKVLSANFLNDSMILVKYADLDKTKTKKVIDNIGWDIWKYSTADQAWSLTLYDDFKSFYRFVTSKLRIIETGTKFRNFLFLNDKIVEVRYFPSAFEWNSREFFEVKNDKKESSFFDYHLERDTTNINSDDNVSYDINKNGAMIKLYIYNFNLNE
jgi:hypothetical protein